MHAPAHRRLQHRQAVLLDHWLDDAEGLERGVLEVAGAVHGAHGGGGVRVATLGGDLGRGFVLAREEAAGEGVVDDDVDVEFAAAGDQLGFDGARDGVVHALVDGRLDPAALVAHLPDLGDFPGGVVAEAELDEFAFFVQLVEGLERFSVRNRVVGGIF